MEKRELFFIICKNAKNQQLVNMLWSEKGPSIKYLRKMFRKTNILTPWYTHLRVRVCAHVVYLSGG